MIPKFPDFKNLEQENKEEIQKITLKYPPYSDFNFTSMWCWDINKTTKVSSLNENLVIRFADYITGEPFYSFLGENEPNQTAKSLIELSIKEGLKPELRLMPEISTMHLNSEYFNIKEDIDNFDYIISVNHISTYTGSQFLSKRNYVNRFKKNYKHENRLVEVLSSDIKNNLLQLFKKWTYIKGLSHLEFEHELEAFRRFLRVCDQIKNIAILEIYIKEILVGFWVVEIVSNKYAVSHFEKADTLAYKGIYPYMKQAMAIFLLERGILYVNLEQDLGIPGLRQAKSDYRPCTFLKKYSVQLITSN